MHFKQMRPFSVVFVLSFLVLAMAVSCSDDSESKKPSFDDYAYAGVLKTTIMSNGVPSSTEGHVTITEDGEVTIELIAGTLEGTAEETADGYIITITNASGGFADVTDITGTIDVGAGTTSFSGTNPGGSSVTITGEVAPIPSSDGGWDNLEKAAAIFTHSEADLLVSITVNGVTFDGLNAFYWPGGRCDSYYALANSIRSNLDDKESEIFCHSGTLKGLDGQPVNFTDCNTIRFVLDKDTEYTYTAEWSNGSVSSGEFKTPGGGAMIAICPSPGDGGSGGSCSNAANTFKVGGKSFNIASTECGSDGYYHIAGVGLDESGVAVILPSAPTKNATYAVIGEADAPDGVLPAGKAVISLYAPGVGDYYSKGGGTVSITIVNGNVQANFCNIPMEFEDGSSSSSASGKITCQ